MNSLTDTQGSFVDEQLLNNLGNLSPMDADKYQYGITKVDDEGNIELYNQYNRDEFIKLDSSPIGRNYFTEIAPCANNFMFFGRFKRGVENNDLDWEFDYVFTYKMMPTKVRVRLYRDEESNTNWIFVIKK